MEYLIIVIFDMEDSLDHWTLVQSHHSLSACIFIENVCAVIWSLGGVRVANELHWLDQAKVESISFSHWTSHLSPNPACSVNSFLCWIGWKMHVLHSCSFTHFLKI